jgi:flagellar hook-length control protein FliK
MFSLQDTPVQIDGISFAEIGPGGVFSHLNDQHTDFSKVMAELQQLEGGISLQQLAENPAMLEDLGLSSHHLKMLQGFLADGKSLPEAAQAVLFDLKQQLAELLNNEASTEQMEKIEALQQEMTALLDFLPEDLRSVVETELQALQQMIDPLKQQLDSLAQSEISEDTKNVREDASITGNSGKHTVNDEQVAIDQEAAEASENASLAAAMVNHAQQNARNTDRKSVQGGTKTSSAIQNNAVNQSNIGNGAAFLANENGHADADAEYDLHFEGKTVAENKVMPNLTSQQATSRVAQLQMNDQVMSSQAMAKFSGQGTSSNMQSGSNNASYTQLMTHTTPSPVTQNLHKPEWGNAIGQRITWMIGNKLQGVQLRISPAHLGPVDIKLSIESGVAQVSFASNHQVVREALEQAVPRLRDMLENQNLELGDVDISDRSLADSRRMQDEFADSQGNSAESDNEAELAKDAEDQAVAHVLQSDNLLDAYA